MPETTKRKTRSLSPKVPPAAALAAAAKTKILSQKNLCSKVAETSVPNDMVPTAKVPTVAHTVAPGTEKVHDMPGTPLAHAATATPVCALAHLAASTFQATPSHGGKVQNATFLTEVVNPGDVRGYTLPSDVFENDSEYKDLELVFIQLVNKVYIIITSLFSSGTCPDFSQMAMGENAILVLCAIPRIIDMMVVWSMNVVNYKTILKYMKVYVSLLWWYVHSVEFPPAPSDEYQGPFFYQRFQDDEVLGQTKTGPPSVELVPSSKSANCLKLDWPSDVSKRDLAFQNENLLLNLYHQCSFVAGKYNIAGVDNLVGRIGFQLLSPLHFSKLVEHRKTLNECYKVVIDFGKNLVTLCTSKLSTKQDIFVANLHPENEQPNSVEMSNILRKELLNNVLTSRLSCDPNVKAQPTLHLDTAIEKMDGYLKAEHQSLFNLAFCLHYHQDWLYIYTTSGRSSIQFDELTPSELLRVGFVSEEDEKNLQSYGLSLREVFENIRVPGFHCHNVSGIVKWDFLKKQCHKLESFSKNKSTYSVGWLVFTNKGYEDEENDKKPPAKSKAPGSVNDNKEPAKPNAINKKPPVKPKGGRLLLHPGQKREGKVSPNLGHVVNLGYLMQIPCPIAAGASMEQLTGKVKVLLSDVDPKIKYPCFPIDSEITIKGIPPTETGVVKSYAYKKKDQFPLFFGYIAYKEKLDGTQQNRISKEEDKQAALIAFPPAEYTKQKKELQDEDLNNNLNPFLYHFKTGFNALVCAKNGRLVLTNLEGCKQIEDLKTRLNIKKGQFDEEEASLGIWEECLKYVSEELFPDYDKGDTDAMDHMWAMDICYSNMGIRPEVQSEERERLEQDGHTFPANEWWCNLTPLAREHIKKCIHFIPGNCAGLRTIQWSEWSAKTEEAIIKKDQLEWFCYSTDNTGFYSTDKRFPVKGNCYKKCMKEVQMEDLHPFLYHFETGYDSLCKRCGHLVLTILDGCKLTNIEAEAFAALVEALDYVNYKLFLDHEKGNTDATNHIWGLGIILLHLLCGYPPLNGKEDIHCYDTIGTGPKAEYTANTEQSEEIKVTAKDTERKCVKEQWDSFMNKSRKQSKTKKQKMKQLKNKQKKEEEDGNKRNIHHCQHLYEKHWNSPEDLENYNNYSIACGTWGRDKVLVFATEVSDDSNFRLNGIADLQDEAGTKSDMDNLAVHVRPGGPTIHLPLRAGARSQKDHVATKFENIQWKPRYTGIVLFIPLQLHARQTIHNTNLKL
eukprot:jgi/Psemu1/20438/gm1.20438_g